MLEEITKAVTAGTELLKVVYDDLAKPLCAQTGKALGTVVGSVNGMLIPLEFWNERRKRTLHRNLQLLDLEMQAIPMEKVIEPSPEVAVPILEKLTYVENDALAGMYAKLLASASHTELVGRAHPSFANVIDHMSPDEALLLEALKHTGQTPFVLGRLADPTGKWYAEAEFMLPARLRQSVKLVDNCPAYISNLQGLGLIVTTTSAQALEFDLYTEIENYYRPLLEEIWIGPNRDKRVAHLENLSVQFHRGKVNFTPYGQLFMLACTK